MTQTICMFTPSAYGGHAQYTWELLNAMALQRPDYSFELVTGQDLDKQFDSPNYTINRILQPLAHRNDLPNKAAWIANRLMHYPRRDRTFLNWLSERPDITTVHLQEWTPWRAAGMIRRIKAMGKRVFHTCHNVVPHKFPRLVPKPVYLNWIRSAERECDGVFVLSDVLRDEFSRFLQGKHPPVHVVPHGVWSMPQSFQATPIQQRLVDKKLLCFGTIRSNKGIDLLLRAMDQLPGYSLTIAGFPFHREYFDTVLLPLVKQLREKGVKVDLLDRFIDDAEVPQIFASHAAIVLPYTKDFVAQSGVAFLALAYELPMVASKVGGLRDLFEEFKVGTSFADATPEALATAVKELFAMPNDHLAGEIAAAREKYSWKNAARATLAGYSHALQPTVVPYDCPATTAAN